MPTFSSNGAELYYETHGSGETIVFVHGATWDHRQWAPQVEHFSPNYRVVLMDVRGHGRSTLPPGPVDNTLFRKDLVALLDHIGCEKAVICGLSMGGHIALQAAACYPERISRIIPIGAPFTNSFNLYEKIAVPINRFSCRLLPLKTIGRMQAKVLEKDDPALARYIEDVYAHMDHDTFNRVWAAVTRMESRDLLPNIQCPTLLLVGDGDTLTLRQQQTMLELIPRARLVTIDHAHHATNLDNPEQVNAEIDAFLATS